jgi:uncharacterized membrane protein
MVVCIRVLYAICKQKIERRWNTFGTIAIVNAPSQNPKHTVGLHNPP